MGHLLFQAMPSDIIRDQICNMSEVLTKANLKINPTSQIQALEELRHQLLHVYRKSARPEHTQARKSFKQAYKMY